MEQLGPTAELSLWLGSPGGQLREKQWHEVHLAGDMVHILHRVSGPGLPPVKPAQK